MEILLKFRSFPVDAMQNSKENKTMILLGRYSFFGLKLWTLIEPMEKMFLHFVNCLTYVLFEMVI